MPYRKIAQEVGLAREIADGYTWAAIFINPVLDGTCADNAVWQPQPGAWTATG